MENWQPAKSDRICSAHFVGNEKSNIENHPAYHPTIFPKEYFSTTTNRSQQALERFDRNQSRKHAATVLTPRTENDENIFSCSSIDEGVISDEVINTCDFSCQVDLSLKTYQDTGTQTNLCMDMNVKTFSDQCVGNNDTIKCQGFHGHSSLQNDEHMISACGVIIGVFNLLLLFLTSVHFNEKLYTVENQLALFLMKIKLGLSHVALGILFNVHASTVSRIFLSKLNELCRKTSQFVYWPDRKVINATMPKAFKMHYPRTQVIMDCTEISIESPGTVDNRVYCYSHYKSQFTAKFLLGVAPNGFITFVSKVYGGRSSDTFITNDCGILKLLEANDVVLADKGFPGIKCSENAIIVIPPFVHGGVLSVEEIEKTYSIASVRIHVERSIQRIKIYKILQKISHDLFPYLDDIILMACVLTNMQPPIINESKDTLFDIT